MEEPNTTAGPSLAARVEASRRDLLNARARLRALAERERLRPLPLAALLLRLRLQIEAHTLPLTIRRLLTTLPDDSTPE
jgi:hypothetical protein